MMDELMLVHWEQVIEARIREAKFIAAVFRWLDGGKHLVLIDVSDIPPGVWEDVEFWRGEPFL